MNCEVFEVELFISNFRREQKKRCVIGANYFMTFWKSRFKLQILNNYWDVWITEFLLWLIEYAIGYHISTSVQSIILCIHLCPFLIIISFYFLTLSPLYNSNNGLSRRTLKLFTIMVPRFCFTIRSKAFSTLKIHLGHKKLPSFSIRRFIKILSLREQTELDTIPAYPIRFCWTAHPPI